MESPIIQIKSLSKQYRDADIFSVDNLSLDVKKGDIFGLLGPNGAGKTTLISMLCGLIKPTSGEFKINGLSYKNDSKNIKKIIGVVPQEYALYPTLTARENLEYFGAMYGLKGKDLKEARANAYAATEWVHFDNKYKRNDIGKAIDEA